MRLLFELRGVENLAANFRGAASDIQDFRDAAPEFARLIGESAALQIASAGARGGKPYAPLARATERYKRKHFPGKAVLRRTDEMFRLAASGKNFEANADGVTLRVTLKRALLHQKGTRRMPAREVFAPTAEDAARVVEVAQRVTARKLEERGFKA